MDITTFPALKDKLLVIRKACSTRKGEPDSKELIDVSVDDTYKLTGRVVRRRMGLTTGLRMNLMVEGICEDNVGMEWVPVTVWDFGPDQLITDTGLPDGELGPNAYREA